MSIWFALFLLLSLTLLSFHGWTLYILYQQKSSWKAYAKQKKLRYSAKSFLGLPELNGPVGDYSVSLFTGEHMGADMRGTRKLTAIEIPLSSTMPINGGIASGGLVRVMQRLNLKEESVPDHKKWDKSYIAVSENRAVMDEYLTKPRLDILMTLMGIKNGWAILVFKDDTTLLRFDTPEALDSEKKLDVIINKMIEAAKILELQPGELERLKSVVAKKPRKQAGIAIKSDELEIGNLQLEDDEDKNDQPSSNNENPSTENS